MSFDLDTLSFVLLGSISTVALLSIRNAKGPDVHPLLLNSQADASRLRHAGETAIYRSRMHPNGSPLMLTMDRNIRTLHDLFEHGGANSNPNAKFLGNFNGSTYVWVRIRPFGCHCHRTRFISLNAYLHSMVLI